MCCLWTGGEVSEEGGESVQQLLDSGKIQPVAPARRLGHQRVGGTAAPVIKVSPSAAENYEPPLLLVLADRDAHRISLCHLAAVFPQRARACSGRIPPGECPDGKTGLLPRDSVTGDQPGHLIKIDPVIHAASMPGLRARQ